MFPMLLRILVGAAAAATPLPPVGDHLETIKVADGVYLFKPKIDWSHGNGVAIIGPDGVFFIDTYIQFNYAEEAIRRLKAITKLPVRYVLNTHWHNDHVLGNGVFKLAFPDSRFIAHDSTVGFMEQIIKPAVLGEADAIEPAMAQVSEEIATWQQKGSKAPIVGTMRPFWEMLLREVKEYRKEFHPAPFVNADITFSDSLTFRWGANTVKLVHMAENGHSSGDVLVWIPEKRLAVTGDLVVAPTPYATYFNSPGMVKALRSLIALNPAILIPGHGPVEYDLEYVRLLERAFREYRQAAEAALSAGTPLKEAMDNVRLPEIDVLFTGEDDLKKWAYRSFFLRPLIYNTFRPTPDDAKAGA